MSTLAVVAAAALGTYVLRSALLVGLAGRTLPAGLSTALSFVGPAALSALLAGAVTSRAGGVDLPQLAAVVAGYGAVRRTGKVGHAFLVGLPVLWALTAASAL